MWLTSDFGEGDRDQPIQTTNFLCEDPSKKTPTSSAADSSEWTAFPSCWSAGVGKASMAARRFF
jgi:hypothetical protein